ncbi:DUF2169 domain-containing protein [Myxococcus sp. MxC21-1]|uniref:DUF2169 family type VI secretion system accessory protein n=1 Tax=Myxococcus sp. MxC21-1 TaxID=3041439 RepID=UPI00292EA5E1|nr:DUF2169 domain-containing protein [Myxococcus sp. MxC21-1]WNZ61369.1 DUF2169 domain-containing protein [Myxococcus sp. MxC21-1]
MWRLLNRTPYAAERTWMRSHDGQHLWIVAVKATYELGESGKLKIADKQLPPLLAPEYRGDPGSSSLLYDVDLTDTKPGTDIILNASAYARGGKPTRELLAGFRLGPVKKLLNVRGERIWESGLLRGIHPSEPRPFSCIKITYEQAFGGMDSSNPAPLKHRMENQNPVGRGFAITKEHLVGKPVPNVTYPDDDAISRPAGFGALASYWSPRRELWGTFDEAWMKKRRPLLPVDYNSQALMCSPIDQRPTGYLRGGERVRLLHLTPAGQLEFDLPKVELRFQTRFGHRRVEHASQLSMVVIEPDAARLLMTWHTALPCHHDAEALDETTITETRGRHRT